MTKKIFKQIAVKSSVILLLSIAFLLTSCTKEADRIPGKITIASGNEQCTQPGKKFPAPIRITVADTKGDLLPGCRMIISIPEGSNVKTDISEAVTDAGGTFFFNAEATQNTGDQYITVYPADYPENKKEIRLISGLLISGDRQETASGTETAKNVSVQVFRKDGTPAPGVPVYFSNGVSPAGAEAKLSANFARTGNDGTAGIKITSGKATGGYNVNIDVVTPDSSFRPVKARVLGLNLLQLLLTVGGGLGLFIYGMNLMSTGLRNAAGERMRGILRFFSRNRVIALIAGIGVTAVIQSSSATTVMVVGFINAGLMNLTQSLGIMLGAHIGTTITAQMVAFKLDSLIMPTIIIGLILNLIQWKRLRGAGDTILGFGLLFFGMKIMSSELKLIAEFPSFIKFFSFFDCSPADGSLPMLSVLGAILIGTLATMIIQSSSATSGIVIALGSGGLINLYTAVALVLGANIGTTITAVIAALPANRVAKQAALANSLCAVIGVMIITFSFLIKWGDSGIPLFFYLIEMLSAGNALDEIPQNLPRHIANAHTLFNIITSLLLLPFIRQISALCEKIIPAGSKVKFQYLEPHLLSTPAIALEQTVNVLRKMLDKSCKMVHRATGFFIKQSIDEAKFAALERKESRIDRLQFEITDYLTRIMQRPLSRVQANVIPVLMHCTNDAERVADHTENILMLTRRLTEAGHTISKLAVKELEELRLLLEKQSDLAVKLLAHYDAGMEKRALEIEKEIAQLADKFEDTHIQRLRERTCNAESGVIFIEMLNEINKVSARLSNIIERVASIHNADLCAHDADMSAAVEN